MKNDIRQDWNFDRKTKKMRQRTTNNEEKKRKKKEEKEEKKKREISASHNREKKRDSICIDTTHIVKCANYLLHIHKR
jgi:hypothetical protein